jgi:hypothetical protein
MGRTGGQSPYQHGCSNKSLAELSIENQRVWACEYTESRRAKRRYFWVLVTVLLGTTGYIQYVACTACMSMSMRDSILMAIVFPFAVEYIIYLAVKQNEDGFFTPKDWAAAWLIALFYSSLSASVLYPSGRYILATLDPISAIAAMAMALRTLGVPPAPHVPWELAEDDYLINVTSARGGYYYRQAIMDYQDAEEIAASWLRRFGNSDARVTRKGKDDGIDVYSVGAIAQVKWWKTKNVGIVDVQRLVGAAAPGQSCHFFAAKGYTKEARRWAASSDRTISLFLLHADGNVTAVNYGAKKALWRAPLWTPSAHRKPMGPKERLAWSVIPFLISVIFALIYGWQLIVNPDSRSFLGVFIVSLIVGTHSLALWHLLGSSMRRLVAFARQPPSTRRWPGWTVILTDPIDDRDSGLASDRFVGYGGSPFLFRTVDACMTIARGARAIRRLMGMRR